MAKKHSYTKFLQDIIWVNNPNEEIHDLIISKPYVVILEIDENYEPIGSMVLSLPDKWVRAVRYPIILN